MIDTHQTFVCLFCAALLLLPNPTAPLAARTRTMERDIDMDGTIDQVAHMDKDGKLARLDIDSNKDGLFDKVQFYREGKLIRIESDRNLDGKVDARDLFEDEKRVRHQRLTAHERVEQLLVFDHQERPLIMQRDT
ncbi:MAG: hypothetical protein KFF68_08900, partial [Desulfosarcina sp.]|nr:hypothetical protein [Desulfosarcina sp.]